MKRLAGFTIALVVPIISLLWAGTTLAGELEPKFGLILSEEYNSNVAENKERTLGGDLITHAVPSATFRYVSPFLVGDVGGSLEYRYYAGNKKNSELVPNLLATTRMSLVEERVFLDVSDNYQRVSLDQAQDWTKQSLSQNQSDQNNFFVSPNMVLQPTPRFTLTPGVYYRDIWYSDPAGNSKYNLGARMGASYELTDRWSIVSNYLYEYTKQKEIASETHEALTGLRYEFFKNSFIIAQGGYTWFSSQGKSTADPTWNLAVNYDWGLVNVRAGINQKYSSDPTTTQYTLNTNYDLSVGWTLENGKVDLTSGVTEVMNMPQNSLFSRSYNNKISLQRQLYTDWTMDLGCTYNYIDIRHSDTFTTVFNPSSGITYDYSSRSKFSLSYSYLKMYSPDIYVDNKIVNSMIIQWTLSM